MEFFAHSGSTDSTQNWQKLAAHLMGVAELAGEFGRLLGIERLAALAGLLHDLGKYTPEFQKRLHGGAKVDHSTAGAKVVLERTTGKDRLFAELIAFAILGHHAGLPDRQNDSESCFNWRIDAFKGRVDPIWERELAAEFAGLAPETFPLKSGREALFQLSVLGRMLFSCLVDADRKDTEAHYASVGGPPPDRSWPDLQTIVAELRLLFDRYMAGLPTGGSINGLRAEILSHVRSQAGACPSFFTLTVPTGGGKTLASLGFALDHAARHGQRRIIYAIPFTSVIDQTAAVFRKVLGEDVILEHHSAIDEDDRGGKLNNNPDASSSYSQKDKLRLAMEDWGAPVVVTTNVQLFESLFAARPSRARKLHNVAGSVIILDEAQTLPPRLLMPVLRMLEELVTNYGCTIVLCTATQPALEKRDNFAGLDLTGRELAPDPVTLNRRLRRATIRPAGAMDNAALVTAMAEERQALVIVNSRKHALELFRSGEAASLEGLVHLSTRQCAAHRQEILDAVRQRLKDGLQCRVVATSLIEAGVDVDFPKVWRAEAGLDQIVQAAGRCNREGRQSPEDSIVSVFQAPEYPPPREIAALIGNKERALGRVADIHSLAAIEAYFAEVYWHLGDKLDDKRILDDFFCTREGLQFAYRSVADKFRMIESGMEPVIIPYDDRARAAIAKLGMEAMGSGTLARELQRYIVQVPPKARHLLIANGHATYAHAELRGDQFVVLKNENLYITNIGLLWDDAAYLSIDSHIF